MQKIFFVVLQEEKYKTGLIMPNRADLYGKTEYIN